MENSPLNRISPELRNRIYELVFTPEREVECLDSGAVGNIQHPLTKTCRQIRAETLMMDYANTHYSSPGSYYWDQDDGGGEELSVWLKKIGPQACSTIRSLHAFHGQEKCKERVSEFISRGGSVEILDVLGNLRWMGEWAPAVARTLREMGIQLRLVEERGDIFTYWRVEVVPPE
ncbi:hypothetical protein LTR85_008772 [Meristemomyces frigidus]|nr:hypothetical protein LTR85_008772 [Meristemomyces frigidus]